MRTTCGIFLFNSDGKLLVGHPTNHPMNVWSIPKGIKDKGEAELAAAFRELSEETNIFIEDMGKFDLRYLGTSKYKHKKKALAAFYVDTNKDFSSVDVKCDSMVTDMPGKDFPEIDEFKWVTIEEAKSILHETQVPFLEDIEKLRNNVTQV